MALVSSFLSAVVEVEEFLEVLLLFLELGLCLDGMAAAVAVVAFVVFESADSCCEMSKYKFFLDLGKRA